MKIQPFPGRLAIQRIEQELITPGGLILPENAREKPQLGKVCSVGPALEADVKEGDTVIFAKYGGTEIEFAGESYLILSEKEVLAVVK